MRRWLAVVLVAGLLGVPVAAWPQAHYQSCHVNALSKLPVTCRTGPGTLYAVTINTKGANGNYTYIFDLASYSATSVAGTPLLKIDTTAGLLTLIYNILVTTGVVVWNTQGTVADITVSVE